MVSLVDVEIAVQIALGTHQLLHGRDRVGPGIEVGGVGHALLPGFVELDQVGVGCCACSRRGRGSSIAAICTLRSKVGDGHSRGSGSSCCIAFASDSSMLIVPSTTGGASIADGGEREGLSEQSKCKVDRSQLLAACSDPIKSHNMFPPRRPDQRQAMKELQSSVLMFSILVAAVRFTPYLLHGLQKASSR